MEVHIKNNFPKNIQSWLSQCDQETQTEIQELFTLSVPGIENCGELIFKGDEYSDVLEAFEELSNEE